MRARPCGWRRISYRCGRHSCNGRRRTEFHEGGFLSAEAVPNDGGLNFMDAEKIRNLTDEELRHREREMNDELFKLKFQLNMGQTESLKKIRGLRKDIARVKTIARERGLRGETK